MFLWKAKAYVDFVEDASSFLYTFAADCFVKSQKIGKTTQIIPINFYSQQSFMSRLVKL